jgi:DNA-binding transcriptional LysR family regulator
MQKTNLSANQLRTLVAIAETGSFTLAAERLGLTQPGVSHSVSELEANLQVRLFERRRGEGAVPTASGSRALVEARAALTHIERLEAAARDEARLISGRLRIGCFPSADRSRVPSVLATFHRRFPRVTLEVLESGGENTERDIRTRAHDLSMVSLPTASDFATFPAYTDELMAVVRKDSEVETTNGQVSVRAISRMAFLMPDDTTTALVQSVFAAAGCRPRDGVMIENAGLRLELVRQGLGATLMPANNLPPPAQLRALRVLPLRPRVFRYVAFAALSLEALSPAATAFLEVLSQQHADF